MIARLLLERISLRGICRAVGVGLQWLLQFMVEHFQAAPEHLYVEPRGGAPAVILQRLEAELDELWTSWARRRTGSGCGLRWTPRLDKSLPFTSATAARVALNTYEPIFPLCIGSGRYSTRITIPSTKV